MVVSTEGDAQGGLPGRSVEPPGAARGGACAETQTSPRHSRILTRSFEGEAYGCAARGRGSLDRAARKRASLETRETDGMGGPSGRGPGSTRLPRNRQKDVPDDGRRRPEAALRTTRLVGPPHFEGTAALALDGGPLGGGETDVCRGRSDAEGRRPVGASAGHG